MLKTITSDSEIGLIKAIENNFPNINKINCFYHYKCNIIKNAKLLGLCNKKNKDIDINITKKLFMNYV